MSISMLMQRDDESKRLVQWVEGGAARNGRAASPPGAAAHVLRQPYVLLQPHAPTTPPTVHLCRCSAHFPAHPTSLPATTARRRRSCPSCLLPPPSFPAGVADALERRYLRKVFFGLSSDREGKDLLEEVRHGGVVGLWVLRWMLGAASWWVLGADWWALGGGC